MIKICIISEISKILSVDGDNLAEAILRTGTIL